MRAPWLIGLVTVLSLATDAAGAENRLAFVVGNDAYRNVNPLESKTTHAQSVSLRATRIRVMLGKPGLAHSCEVPF
jgi:hypothetical protein